MCSHNKQNLNLEIIKNGGQQCLQLARLWEKEMMKVVRYKEHVTFNKKCLVSQVIPKTLVVKACDNLPSSHRAAKECSLTFLKNRLYLSKKKLNQLYKISDSIMNKLKNNLPGSIIEMIKFRANKMLDHEKIITRNRQKRKFNKLVENNIISKPNLRTNETTVNQTIDINLSDSWYINLSSKNFNAIEQSIFKLDPKYQVTPRRICAEKIIANIEPKLKYLITDKSELARIRVSLVNSLNGNHFIKPNLSKAQISAINKLKTDPDIFITQSDKGSKTVILNRVDYISKVNEILADQNVYTKINNSNINSIANQLVTILKDLKQKKYLDIYEYKHLYPICFDTPEVYALIKIHKENNPARLICPYFSHPLSKTARFISETISPTIRNSKYSLKDSKQLTADVQKLHLAQNDIMISLDVVNLFTNIPIEKTMKIIENKLNSDKELSLRCKIPVPEIMNLIMLCMKSTTFTFNGKCYSQKSGAPMGSNLSPVIAEALISSIFEESISTFTNKPKFLRFFVDDSFLIINKRFANNFLKHINKVAEKFKTIKFTIEYETSSKLPFLDLLVERKSNKLKTTVYRKPTHSNRYLNFRSHHSFQDKKSVIRTLVHRAFTHCSDDNDRGKELTDLHNILVQNDYPSQVITDTVTQCSRNMILNDQEQSNLSTEFNMDRVITIPYYKNLSESIRYLLAKNNIKVVFQKGLTIKNLLTPTKSNDLAKSNVVYDIKCNTCNAVYVGTTKRKLCYRVNEHKNALAKHNFNSNIAEHAIQNNHSIDFDNPSISYVENKNSSRIFLESFRIETLKQKNKTLINDQQNSKTIIPPVYLSLLK